MKKLLSGRVVPELTPHQLKALDINHSISLRANAGSGKTSVLSKRYLQIAVEGNISLQKIAAITFTDKAAGELYKRISEEIDSLLKAATEKIAINKLEKIRRQLVSANISTIHSFCINILREFPVEAELDANFTPIDQNLSQELLELSIEETLRGRMDEESNEEIKYLIRLLDSKNNLTKQILKLIESRKTVLKLEEDIYGKGIDEITEWFRNQFEKYFEIIFLPQIKDFISDLKKINDEVSQDKSKSDLSSNVDDLLGRLTDLEEIDEIIKIIETLTELIFTKSLSLKKREYFITNLRAGFENEIANVEKLISGLGKIKIEEDSKQIEKQLAITGKYLINLFNETLHLYDQKKKEAGYLDYEDILIKTKNLLKSNIVSEYLNEKYSYLMVDEYQDTNEIQYDIFMPILDYLRKGNLFVVGDEKQSIYRFRDAELEVFNKTNKDISSSNGEDYLLTLPDSFRMDPAICLFTNLLFRNLFNAPNELFNEVEHTDIICAKKDAEIGSVSIIIVDKDSDVSEVNLIASQIIKLVNDKKTSINWKDIAILVRKRRWFRDLEKEFTKSGIPYRIIGGRGFFQRQSIYDIYNYFSFLLDIRNDAALAGILRSPFFTLSDPEIFEISLKPGRSYWQKLIGIEKEENKYSGIVKKLRENIELSGKIDFNSLLRKIMEESDFISVLASRQDGEQELANIEKLLRITNNFSNQGFRTLYDFVSYLKDAINKMEDEAQADMTNISDAVNLLTLHQAKGLEFPVVFLYKCDESSRNEITKSKSVSVDKYFGLLTKVPADGDYFSEYKPAPVLAIRDYIEERKNLAEVKRLFYVGITRAKNHLFLSATTAKNENYNSSSFMGLFYDGLNIQSQSEEIILSDELTFLLNEDGNYRNEIKQLIVKIPKYREIENGENKFVDKQEKFEKKNLLLTSIEDKAEGEIISATKVSTYSQCPLKYKLIYNYGYGELYSEFRTFQKSQMFVSQQADHSYDDEEPEEEAIQPVERADIRGALIHKALQEEIKSEKLEDFFDEEIIRSYLNLFKPEAKDNLIKDSSRIMNKFFGSKQFENLKKYPDYKNEFEIYIQESNYFLYGIIDKIILDKNKILIIDYKTDDIKENEISERADYYINQLKFYIYIVSKLYTEFTGFEVRIIFLKYPDNPFIIVFSKEDLKNIDREIKSNIKGIMDEKFPKNLSHCVQCNFSINKKCII